MINHKLVDELRNKITLMWNNSILNKNLIFTSLFFSSVVFSSQTTVPESLSQNFPDAKSIECVIAARLAEDGHAASMKLYGDLLQNGELCDSDIDAAKMWYSKAYALSDKDAGLELAKINLSNDSDKKVGIELLEEIGKTGNEEALIELGYHFAESNELDKAVKHFEHPSLSDNTQAGLMLGLIYLTEDHLKQDREKGLSILSRTAKMGDALSMLYLGEEIVSEDLKIDEEIRLIRQAGDANEADAINFLSNYYREQQPTQDNLQEALYWSIQSALIDDESSLNYLFDNGNIEQRDGNFESHDELLDFLCDQLGNLGSKTFVPAMEKLGRFYQYGEGCPANLEKAKYWYAKAYEKGSKESGFYLASLLMDSAIKAEREKSIKILRDLAGSGHSFAANDLAVAYENKQKFMMAEHYYKLAANAKLPLAYRNLGFLYRLKNSEVYNEEFAIEAFKKGAALDDLESKYHFGLHLFENAIDEKRGLRLIEEAAIENNARAQLVLGHIYTQTEMKDIVIGTLFDKSNKGLHNLSKAKYWYFCALLGGSLEANYWLANIFSSFDDTSEDFKLSTILYSRGADKGDVDSAIELAMQYLSSHNVANAQHYLELALDMTADDKENRFYLLDTYNRSLIALARAYTTPDFIEELMNEYLELAHSMSKNAHEAYYAKHLFYSEQGIMSQSKVNLLLAIEHTKNEIIKNQLIEKYTNDETVVDAPTGESKSLFELIDKLYESGDLTLSNEVLATVRTINPSDFSGQFDFLFSLEAFADYFLYYNDFSTTAALAGIYVEYLKHSPSHTTNPQRNDKMEILSLLRADYDLVKAKLSNFKKYEQRKLLDKNPAIERLLIETKLNIYHGFEQHAQNSSKAAFDTFTKELISRGLCFRDYEISISDLYRLFSKDELLLMAHQFSEALSEAARKFPFSSLTKSCARHVKDFGEFVQKLSKDNVSSPLSETWFDIYLSTFLYSQFNSQKETLINFASMNKIAKETERARFRQYLTMKRELDDKVGEIILGQLTANSIQNKSVDFEYITQLGISIKRIEDEFHNQGIDNPLNPYFLGDFSVKTIQGRLLKGEAVIIISALEEDVIGFYIDNESFDIIASELSKTQYEKHVNAISASVDQDEAQQVLDLSPFAFDDAFQLYSLFYSKFDSLIENKERILVTTSGTTSFPLNILPTSKLNAPVNSALDFAAYRNVDWFLKNKETLYLSNVNMLLANRPSINLSRKRNTALGITPYWEQQTNRFSLPEISKGLLSFVFQGDSYQTLPPITESIKHVESLTQSKEKTLVLGKDATKQNIISELENERHNIVVFSTHVLADADRVSMPSLVIRDDNGIDFALLTTSDISKVNLGADWVFLIGCNTGRTNFDTDFLSLADSFILAGAKRVVTTDWPIEAKATTALVNFFPDSADISFAKKLSLAQSALRNDRSNVIYAHPMFWGGFRVTGYP